LLPPDIISRAMLMPPLADADIILMLISLLFRHMPPRRCCRILFAAEL